MPFDNTIVLMRMTGGEIHELLEQSIEARGFLFPPGCAIASPWASQPARASPSPRSFDPERVYEVAVNNFLAQGGDGLTLLAGRDDARDTGILLRDAPLPPGSASRPPGGARSAARPTASSSCWMVPGRPSTS